MKKYYALQLDSEEFEVVQGRNVSRLVIDVEEAYVEVEVPLHMAPWLALEIMESAGWGRSCEYQDAPGNLAVDALTKAVELVEELRRLFAEPQPKSGPYVQGPTTLGVLGPIRPPREPGMCACGDLH